MENHISNGDLINMNNNNDVELASDLEMMQGMTPSSSSVPTTLEDELPQKNEKQPPKRKDTENTLPVSYNGDGESYAAGEQVPLEEDESGESRFDGWKSLKTIDEKPRRCYSHSCAKRCAWISLALLMVICLVLLAAIFLGSRVEAKQVAKASDTLNLYSGNAVCALNGTTSTTFSSADAANAAGLPVAHCGTCGGCSSVQDMTIYAQTRNSLTDDATKCAVNSFVHANLVGKCFDKRVGFTPACRDCWVDNIACTKKRCKWTCLKFKLLGQSNNDEDSGDLNKCLQWYVVYYRV